MLQSVALHYRHTLTLPLCGPDSHNDGKQFSVMYEELYKVIAIRKTDKK